MKLLKRIMESKAEGRRKIGRSKNRRMGGVLQDIRTLKIKNWWMLVRDRDVWRGVLREAMAQLGLLCQI